MRTKKRARGRVLPDVASHPGEHIADTIAELKISQAELARRMGRPQPAINQIVRGLKAVTAETAVQLEAVTGVSAETWMNLQTNYDLVQARRQATVGAPDGWKHLRGGAGMKGAQTPLSSGMRAESNRPPSTARRRSPGDEAIATWHPKPPRSGRRAGRG